MRTWPRYPSLFEINTWVWLSDLSLKFGHRLDLGSVPPAEWDTIAGRGFDAVWLMGVWERSPRSIAISNANQGLLEEFRRSLPDFRLADNVGSPYSVRRYVVDQHLGGPEGLATARRELAKRGIRLIVDLVPNHVAPTIHGSQSTRIISFAEPPRMLRAARHHTVFSMAEPLPLDEIPTILHGKTYYR